MNRNIRVFFSSFPVLFASLLSVMYFFTACDDTGEHPTDNSVKIDTMTALISGEVNKSFFTTAVNINDYSDDTSRNYLISGTMIVSPVEIYTVYVLAVNVKDGVTEYSLKDTDGLTRLQFDAGAIGKILYAFNVDGTLTITENETDMMSGTFNFTSTNADSTEFIEVEQGNFVFKIK